MASCLDPSVYQRCFSILHPSGLFCLLISMWSPWQGRRLCKVHGILCNSHMHIGSGGSMFLLLLLWVRLRSSALFVESINSFGSKAHSIEIVCYGYVSPAFLSILAVVALRSRVSNFLTSSLSVRAQTRWNWTFHSFTSSVGMLHLLARALRKSTSSSGVSLGLILTSSNWYI